MSDRDARAFRRTLTITLSFLGLLTAGAVVLFGHLLFKALSKDVVNDALLRSRLDAERLAKGLAERSAGDPFLLRLKQTEIERYLKSGIAERQIVTDVQVIDVTKGEVVYSFSGTGTKTEEATRPPAAEGSQQVEVEPGTTIPRTRTLTRSLADPYDIQVPIGDFAVLQLGVSRKELEKRVEKLRKELYLRTFAAAVVSLLGIGAASSAVILLFRRNRRVEEERSEAERRAELGEVAAGLAHEIRNPLNAMSLNLEMLEEQLQGLPNGPASRAPAQAIELAGATRQETGRLARLLTDFLSYARPSPIVPRRADLNEPAAEAVAFLLPEAERRRIRLEFTPHPGGAPAQLDVARVKQVVMNLVGNALDAVEAEGASAREVCVKVEDADRFWKLTVADRGPGVPPQKAPELFKLFVSTKPAGTGLGLPIAERIVRAHGGTLTLGSETGGPTRAVATFPKTAVRG